MKKFIFKQCVRYISRYNIFNSKKQYNMKHYLLLFFTLMTIYSFGQNYPIFNRDYSETYFSKNDI